MVWSTSFKISGPALIQDFEQVQNHLTEPGFIEYFKFDTSKAVGAYVQNHFNQGLELSSSEGQGAWYKGNMPYPIFNQLLLGILPLESGKGFCPKCGTHGTTNTMCKTCDSSHIVLVGTIPEK
jgi:hypothetical protein